MPRPNLNRSIAAERSLARRIAYERERRGQTYDGLASRMTKAGCAIQSSGIYKIEKAGRRITVDEAVALARVWGLSVEELLQPVEMILNEDIARVEAAEQAAWTAYYEAVFELVGRRIERAALYRRAEDSDDEEFVQALVRFIHERRSNEDAAMEGRARSVRDALADADAEWDSRTEEQLATDSAIDAIDGAMVALDRAIYDNTDPILRQIDD